MALQQPVCTKNWFENLIWTGKINSNKFTMHIKHVYLDLFTINQLQCKQQKLLEPCSTSDSALESRHSFIKVLITTILPDMEQPLKKVFKDILCILQSTEPSIQRDNDQKLVPGKDQMSITFCFLRTRSFQFVVHL